MNNYQQFWKPILFQLDAEQAHYLSASLLNVCEAISPVRSLMKQMFVYSGEKPTEKVVAGIRFPNPVGLAAGFDKNATMVDALPLLGFGFAEIGTVTPRPQKGNPRPRLFRIPEEGAILNRMGFNNDGVQVVANRLAKRKNQSMIIDWFFRLASRFATTCTPSLLKPIRFRMAPSSGMRNNRGLGLPFCGRGVTVPISAKPKPSSGRASTIVAFLSNPAASPTGLGNRIPATTFSVGFSPEYTNICFIRERTGEIASHTFKRDADK